tara:strand:+ start:318 stop:497 length:180 start_codon:yes stop_codon:yes gene_type:complete
MDKDSKKEALSMLEEIMKLSLHYCRDSDDEIRAYSIRINNKAHDLAVLLERGGNQSPNL